MASSAIESLYRSVFSDLTVSREEDTEIRTKLEELNVPPDKIVWVRAAAFRIGCEYLTEDDADANVQLLRCINAIVHAVEMTCLVPKDTDADEDSFPDEEVETLYKEAFADLSVDQEESAELVEFFAKCPKSKIISTRAAAFKHACDFLSDDRDTNVALLRCINVMVHALENTCMVPKPYTLKEEVSPEISVEAIGLDASISKAVQHVWDLDVNRLTPNEDYVINVQSGKKPYWAGDDATEPLFTRVDTRELQRPTYKTFIALLDNYSAECGDDEVVTNAERAEIWNFLKAIYSTAPMQFAHKYCAANGDDVPSDPAAFLKLLHKIWFEMYFRQRGGRPDSSGFEHVFVGEIKNGEVSGFHNWIYFYLEEKRGNVNYKGYIKPRSRSDAATNADDQILTLQFEWNGVEKKVGTSFIGVSPEFEMALYTICFLVGQEQNTVELDTGDDVFELNVRCYRMARDKVGTSFVEASAHWEE
mmetsp:Transcript_31637/g.68446  ORF Transcript_31637/g.68446 Transcript_31637/m.68446 type:complete len:476 (-) Transcript_31637:79-1506(-)